MVPSYAFVHGLTFPRLKLQRDSLFRAEVLSNRDAHPARERLESNDDASILCSP